MNLLYYLAEANIYLGVFYLAYCLLLTKETYYQLTRAYLLFACVIAFILPVLQIGALKPVEEVVTTTINYSIPEYIEPIPVTSYVNTAPVVIEHHLTLQDYLVYIYIIGAAILFLLLMVKLSGLFRLMRNAQTVSELKYKVVYLPETGVAFSFFNYLFIGNNASGANTIIRHELVHIRQKHSVDIIFLEVLKVVSWFNPFIYLLQNSLKTVHEYIADEQTAALETDALTYSTFLVNNAYGTGGPSFTHSFFNYNLLKKRIIMLHQQRSGSLARLKYLVTVPICAALLCTSTLAFSKTYGWVDLDPAKPIKKEVSKTQSSEQKSETSKFAPPSAIILRAATGPKPKLIVVDGKIRYPKPEETVSADSMVDVPANTSWAIKKWGDKAKNGVRLFIGHGQVIKKSESPFSLRNKFGGRMVGSSHNAQVPITQMLKKDPGLLFIVDGKKVDIDASQLNDKTLISMTGDSMTVYDKGNEYAKSKWGKNVGQVVVLQGHASAKLFNWPKNNAQPPAYGPDPATLLTINFVTYLQNNIKFPNYPLSDNFVLTFNTSFVIGNNKVTDITMVKASDNKLAYTQKPKEPSLSDDDLKSFQTEIIKALQNAPTDYIKPGKYSLPVAFLFKKDNELLEVFNRVISKTPTGSLALVSVPVIKMVKKPSGDDYLQPTQDDWQNFGIDLSRNIKYPKSARDQHIMGKVIALFSVDANHNIQYIKVVRTPQDDMSAEVIRSLKINTHLNILKPGVQYTLPVTFTLGVNDSSSGENVEPGVLPPGTKSDLAKNIYNPNNMVIPDNVSGLIISEVVIRGYIKKS